MSLYCQRNLSPQFVPSTPFLRRLKMDSPFSVVPEIVYSVNSPQSSQSEQNVPRSPLTNISIQSFMWKTPSPAWTENRRYIQQVCRRKSHRSITPLMQYHSPAMNGLEQVVPGTPDNIQHMKFNNLAVRKPRLKSGSDVSQQINVTPKRQVLAQQRRNSPPTPKSQTFELFCGDEIFAT